LLVSIASAVIAWRAKEQAKRAATLEPRTKAISLVREAIHDATRDGLVTGKTVKSLQEALHLSALVFGQGVRNDLDRAYATADRLNKPSEYRTEQDQDDRIALGKDLHALVARMNKEAKLVC
jgi:hypothetical protein